MPETSPTTPPSHAPAKTRRASALLQRLALLSRHHGLWTPGVYLLRNIQLGGKAAVIFLCILLPMGGSMYEAIQSRRATFESIGAEQRHLAQARALSALQMATRGLVGALATHEPGQALSAAQRTALEQEQAAFATLAATFSASSAAAGTVAALEPVARSRQAWKALLGDDRLAALAGAFQSYQARQQDLRHDIEQSWLSTPNIALEQAQINKSLRLAFASQLPALVSNISELSVLGGQIADGSRRPTDLARALNLLGEMRLTLRLSSSALEQVRAARLMDAEALDGRVQRIQAFISRADVVVLRAMRSGDDPAVAIDPDRSLARASTQALMAVDELNKAGGELLAQRLGEIRQATVTRTGIDGVLLVGSLLLCGYFLVCAYKVVGGGLSKLCAQVDELGKGNLSIRPHGLGTDEVGVALTTLGRAAQHMSQLFESVTQGVSAVSHASREVATGNAGLAHRTGDVRSALGTVGERARSFSVAMDSCAREVEAAADHVRTMGADAQRSRKAMQALRERMLALQGKSREIGRVVEMMESVAYQTKLLSLNASVEAARAGPAGKGFSVVAQEVRALAQHSENAARSIHDIISGSIAEIEEGGLVTDRASETVRRTDELTQTVNRIMGDIVRLTRDGMTQAQEVLDITHQVEESVDDNARLVEQLSHASGDLRTQGDQLRRSVQHFVLG